MKNCANEVNEGNKIEKLIIIRLTEFYFCIFFFFFTLKVMKNKSSARKTINFLMNNPLLK